MTDTVISKGVAASAKTKRSKSPTVVLTASPALVPYGGNFTLAWSSTNATRCVASGGWSGDRAVSGSVVVSDLRSSETFTLTCTGKKGTAAQSVVVEASSPSVPSVTLTAVPPQVASGQTVTLGWTTQFATSCTASDGWSGVKDTNGQQSVGALGTNTLFTLTCTGPGGSRIAQTLVTVLPPPPGYRYRGQINLDATYLTTPGTNQSAILEVGELNGDGYVDLLVLGTEAPFNGSAMPPDLGRPGRVFLGDGQGGFARAPASLFPVDELQTVAPRKVLWADFNGDGRSDVFIAEHGWDGPPFPGRQNLLYLSTPEGGWRSATATLPQVSDFTHTAAAADIDRDGDIDIFVGNGYNNGAPATAPHLLINDGQGRFTRNDADVPVAPGQALYVFPAGGGAVHFTGAVFGDLDRDSWPDLVVTADATASYDKFRQTTIFWNQGGRFDSTHVTRLTEPGGLPFHIDLDANFADFDGDDLLDIVLIGTNGNPFYDGSFLQVFRGQGQRQYLDVSAQVLPANGHGGAVDGARTGNPWPMWVRVGDFNGDKGPDFWVEYAGGQNRQDTPVVWINDGKGGFSVIKTAFFVEPGQEWQFGGGVLVPTSTGFQNYTVQTYQGGGLLLTGRATSAPYFGRPGDVGDEVLVGTAGTNWFVGGRGNDVIDGGAGVDYATYFGKASGYSIVPNPAGGGASGFTVIDIDLADGDEGTDKLSSIERLRFADKVIEL